MVPKIIQDQISELPIYIRKRNCSWKSKGPTAQPTPMPLPPPPKKIGPVLGLSNNHGGSQSLNEAGYFWGGNLALGRYS